MNRFRLISLSLVNGFFRHSSEESEAISALEGQSVDANQMDAINRPDVIRDRKCSPTKCGVRALNPGDRHCVTINFPSRTVSHIPVPFLHRDRRHFSAQSSSSDRNLLFFRAAIFPDLSTFCSIILIITAIESFPII
jgi:hypothetical protein